MLVTLALLCWAVVIPVAVSSLAALAGGQPARGSGGVAGAPADSSGDYIFISTAIKGESYLPRRTFARADAVVLGRVTQDLGLRRNPLNLVQLRTSLEEPVPIVYKGYKVEVWKWFESGGEAPSLVTLMCLGGGYLHEDGKSKRVLCDKPTDLAVGSVILAPVVRDRLFGTGMAAAGQFWIETAPSVFVISSAGMGVRLVTSGGMAEQLGARDRYRLEELEAAVVSSGKRLFSTGEVAASEE